MRRDLSALLSLLVSITSVSAVTKQTPYYSLDMAIFVAICLAAIALLSGCAQYPRYHTALPTKARPKLPTYVQCDKNRVCRVYDSRGNRRHDLERK